MEDSKIVELYWSRDPDAISVTAKKYGSYCHSIAQNILNSKQDAEECVNDTYFQAWNTMPPHRPNVLAAFLGKITRNLSFNRWQHRQAEKRGGGELPLILEELGDCVSDQDDVEGAIDRMELLKSINDFLAALPREKRRLFLQRYWYARSITQIARLYHMTPGAVSTALHRIRADLRVHLAERGFDL